MFWGSILAAIISFVVGYVLENFPLTCQVFLAFMVIITLVSVPDWPFWNKNPVNWSVDPSIKPIENNNKKK
jgi:signal peptidase complex subunit 1